MVKLFNLLFHVYAYPKKLTVANFNDNFYPKPYLVCILGFAVWFNKELIN